MILMIFLKGTQKWRKTDVKYGLWKSGRKCRSKYSLYQNILQEKPRKESQHGKKHGLLRWGGQGLVVVPLEWQFCHEVPQQPRHRHLREEQHLGGQWRGSRCEWFLLEEIWKASSQICHTLMMGSTHFLYNILVCLEIFKPASESIHQEFLHFELLRQSLEKMVSKNGRLFNVLATIQNMLPIWLHLFLWSISPHSQCFS